MGLYQLFKKEFSNLLYLADGDIINEFEKNVFKKWDFTNYLKKKFPIHLQTVLFQRLQKLNICFN